MYVQPGTCMTELIISRYVLKSFKISIQKELIYMIEYSIFKLACLNSENSVKSTSNQTLFRIRKWGYAYLENLTATHVVTSRHDVTGSDLHHLPPY